MSGFVAAISHGPDAIASAEVRELASTYATLRSERAQKVVRGGTRIELVMFSTTGSSRGAGMATDGASWVVWTGCPHHHHHQSILEAPLCEIDGAFGLVRYDAVNDRVVIASDPFGMQTLYVARKKLATYVSTSALALAKHVNATPDPVDVATFLRVGLNFGPNTHWQGVERIEPAAQISISPSGEVRSQYWRPMRDRTVSGLSFDSSVSNIVRTVLETFQDSFGASSTAWADLTGGFDTRLMTLGLRRAGVSFETNTAGALGDKDVEIARAIAGRVGWKWTRFGLPDDWPDILPERIHHALGWGDGLLDAARLAEVLWVHEMKSQRHLSLFIGGGGEHFRNFAWQQEFFRAGRSTAVNWDNWLSMRLLPSIDISVFSKDPTPLVRESLIHRMKRWIEPYEDEPNTVKLDMLYAYKSTGHFGSYLSAASAFLTAELPFYLKPIFAAATSTNFRFRNHHRLTRQMIGLLDANIAALRTTTGGPAEPWRATNLHRFAPYYGRVARRAVNKVSQKTFAATVFKGPPRPRRLQRTLVATLNYLEANGGVRYEDLCVAPLLRRRRFEELTEPARAAENRDTALLSRILTAELALREAGGVVSPMP